MLPLELAAIGAVAQNAPNRAELRVRDDEVLTKLERGLELESQVMIVDGAAVARALEAPGLALDRRWCRAYRSRRCITAQLRWPGECSVWDTGGSHSRVSGSDRVARVWASIALAPPIPSVLVGRVVHLRMPSGLSRTHR